MTPGRPDGVRVSLDAAVDGIVVLGEDGTIRDFGRGAAAMFGYSAGEVIGRPADVLFASGEAAPLAEPTDDEAPVPQHALAGSLRLVEARRKDGSVFPGEVSLGAPRDREGGRVRVAILRDLTRSPLYLEYQRQRTEATRARDELQQFAYVTSHDLQEPLRMISGYLDLLLRRHADELSDGARRFVDNAVDGATRMRGLLEALLAYSRVSTRGSPFAPVDLAEAVGEARQSLARPLAEAGAEVRCEGLTRRIWADHAQVAQLFRHLLANALKFRHPDRAPLIQIDARAVGAEVEVAVADNGIGIEAKYAEQIFEVFRRLHTRAEYPGTGIGLAICKRIVERHGGRIWLDTSWLRGVQFRLSLPVSKGKADA